MKNLFILLLLTTLSFSVEYKNGCPVPHNLIEAIKLTENQSSYPYFIRTNDFKQVDKFYEIANKFKYKKTKDNMLIDCLDKYNCAYISYNLINNGISNLDLGLFQINYNSYPKNLFHYFDETASYKNACLVVIDKIKNRKNWSWETLASYHSVTPSLNLIYKKKLIKNYIRLEEKLNRYAYK